MNTPARETIAGIIGEGRLHQQFCLLLSKSGLPFIQIPAYIAEGKTETSFTGSQQGKVPFTLVVVCSDQDLASRNTTTDLLRANLPPSTLVVILLDRPLIPSFTGNLTWPDRCAAISLHPSPDHAEIMEIYRMDLLKNEFLAVLTNFAHAIHCFPMEIDPIHSFFPFRILLEVLNETYKTMYNNDLKLNAIESVACSDYFPAGLFGLVEKYGARRVISIFHSLITHDLDRDRVKPLLNYLRSVHGNDLGTAEMLVDTGPVSDSAELPRVKIPENETGLFLHNIWLSASKRVTQLAHVPIYDANEVIRIFFRTKKGPFEHR